MIRPEPTKFPTRVLDRWVKRSSFSAAVAFAVGTIIFFGEASAQTGSGLPIATTAPTTVVPEYNAKAGYLWLFCRYVEWPTSAFADRDAPIVIGVLGVDPFGDVLTRTVAGKQHDGRSVVVLNPRNAEEARRCHIVFIARENARQQATWLAELRDAPVLTVVENAEGLSEGAVVAFVAESGTRGTRLKFDASLSVAEGKGLKISAPMLSAARRVLREPVKGGSQ